MGEFGVSELIDRFGRKHTDLRVSLTDHCSLRCLYCMPEDFSQWLPNQNLLTTAEIIEVVSVAVSTGITSVRLTGGEPLIHPEILRIVEGIRAIPNPPKVAVTTNGLRLAELAKPLKRAGVDRLNISIDSLRPERFHQITRRDRLSDVLTGIAAAKSAGFAPIKLNAVLMRGVNDDEAVELVEFALKNNLEMRFIEQMPLDPGHTWKRAEFVTAEEIESQLREVFELTPVPTRGSSPAEEFWINGGTTKVGIIASVSRPFCAACDRMRITADGQVRNCLFAKAETDLRKILRADLTAEDRRIAIASVFQSSVQAKLAGHGIGEPDFEQPSRPMSAIGG